ncbi:MAG: tRNA (guanosine(37)-N1)-methyltransferase TrmD [Actinomycetaceae bacterium]|nr:tRNA (guanosine(37)-N1)-methyltransferase TrmD [Actinomycetaceae bacterium]
MNIDIISVFPQFFDALQVSLMGKAQDKDLLHISVHDLRSWTTDPHRTVDDTPCGGGAGMVMKPDVWGQALDECLFPRAKSEDRGLVEGRDEAPAVPLLAIPTPSGTPLTQRLVERIARERDHLVIACGRYEGIDSRVSRHYEAREGVDVLEFSLGDYVLNGGEVAACALIEAVGRLVPEVVGNPMSLVEESHGAGGLLEYDSYTRPVTWRGLDVPEVLLGGNHALIARKRREESLEKTLARRPDLLKTCDPKTLDKHDRQFLALRGLAWIPEATEIELRVANQADCGQLSALARRLFPLACPPELSKDVIADFCEKNFNDEFMAALLADSENYQFCVVHPQGAPQKLLAYTLIELRPNNVEVREYGEGAALYMSKCYADPSVQGSGIAGAILQYAIEQARVAVADEDRSVILGTNEGNRRAKAFYKAHGFKVVGRRIFDVGGVANRDVVMRLGSAR